jgi:hypothetical protein
MSLFVPPVARATDANNLALSGAKWYFYASGGLTPAAVYTTSARSIAHPNPVVAVAGGLFAPIYLDPAVIYRAVLKDATGAVIFDTDPYNDPQITANDIGFSNSTTFSNSTLGKAVGKRGVHASDAPFNLVGDGSDETAALTAFFTHAINNPAIPHYLEAKTYGVSATLPDINISNVWIEGAGAEIHDVGTVMTGTVIKWVGGTSTGTTLLKIEPVSNAGGQRLSGVFFRYIGFDCNSGAIGTALSIKSLQESDIDVATANAFSVAVAVDVVAALGEARDVQRNRIRINGRQVEAPNGYTLTLNGDSGANASMNEIDIEAQCKNVAAIRCINSDNNYWGFVRVALAGGGTASYGMELLGAATPGTSSRAENIEFYSCSLPLKAFGTEAYTAASKGHIIQRIDVDNGTPGPTMGTGATVALHNQWTSFTPTITSGTGTLTTITGASGSYLLNDGGFINFAISFTLTTNGTGATQLRATLPFAAHAAALARSMSGAELSGTGKTLTCTIAPSGTYVAMTFYDGTYPGADGRIFTVSGTYRSAF